MASWFLNELVTFPSGDGSGFAVRVVSFEKGAGAFRGGPLKNATHAEQVAEGRITRLIEHQTARFQSVDWLALAVGSMALSALTTLVFGRRALGNFFGLWAPSLLLIGVYNKLVKVEANLNRQWQNESR